MLKGDLKRVLDARAVIASDTLGSSPLILVKTCLKGAPQAYRLTVIGERQLLVEGSDALGTAYGILDISRRLGVSPWEWWAETEVKPLSELTIDLPEPIEEAPYVEHRGIFINDEDFSLAPWATRQETAEDTTWRYTIGPQTTERICQLLLRLRADTYCPAMHGDTRPFFLTEGDREVAQAYGIYISTSHCEPMASNTNGEWKLRGEGDYNFATNSEAVKRFWQQRLDEVAQQPVIYTLGMRGQHDDPMHGASTTEERKALLEKVFDAQQAMLNSSPASDMPRVFIPYKEVLDVVSAGLRIPEDVAVIQCDDNYGYIRWPEDTMLLRKAGTGLYYHVSYWGRPHDYLWLSTTHPRLMQEELVRFALAGRQTLWTLNVGDIKPAEYQTQLFMDIAWNPRLFLRAEAWREHLRDFLSLSLSLDEEQADSLASCLAQYYDLVFQCRPEFLAATRTEEADPSWTVPKDLPWSEQRLRSYRDSLLRLSYLVDRAEPSVAWMHLVQYPVQAAAQMARKHVSASLARHSLCSWQESDLGHDSIQRLTLRYNTGRWQGFMNASPRRLPVFQRLEHALSLEPLPKDTLPVVRLQLRDSLCCLREGQSLPPLVFSLEEGRAVTVEVSVLPTHPRHSEPLALSLSIDDGDPETLDFTTHGRSEEWKRNVLANRSVRRVFIPVLAPGSHTLRLAQASGGEVFPLEVSVFLN